PPRRRSAPFDILSLIVFQNGHISGALAELIRSTRAPTKGRLKGKIMGGNPAFRGTRVPVHMLAERVPSRVRARTRMGGEVLARAPAEPGHNHLSGDVAARIRTSSSG